MTYVDDAFEKMRQNNEITKTERETVIRRHLRIRATIEELWDLRTTVLTGSYDRHTKIKPLEDVDIFVIVDPDGDQGHYRRKPPSAIVQALAAELDGKFKHVETDGMAVRISVTDDDGDATFELVAVFEHPDGGYEAPDPGRGRWIRTDPDKHATLTAAKNQECGERWIPLVKILKGWNRENGSPVPLSFLIEVMTLELVRPPVGRYQDEVAAFFGNAVDRANGPWPDPAGLGPDVDELVTAVQRDRLRREAGNALAIAEEAIYLEDEGEDRKAVEKWRELFGNRMPRP